MKIYVTNDGWSWMCDDTTYTVCVLEASEVHSDMAKPLTNHTDAWKVVDTDRQAAELGVLRASARNVWRNIVLDRCTTRFAAQLLVDCGNDRAHELFLAFFPGAPAEVTRLALESQLEAMKKFPTMAEAEKLKKGTRALLQDVLDAMAAGEVAVEARKAAELVVAAVSRRQVAWRNEANTLRRATKTALDDYANKNKLPRNYADGFFVASARPAKNARAKKLPQQPAAVPPVVAQPLHAPAVLSETDQVLALPDHLLRALAEEFVVTLPANVQSIVRARRAG